VEKQEYHDVINQVILFLQGKQELILRELNTKMKAAAQQLQFERAALLRDQINAIEEVIEGQRIAITLQGEKDIIGLAQNEKQAYVKLFSIRNNKLIGQDHFIMEGIQGRVSRANNDQFCETILCLGFIYPTADIASAPGGRASSAF